MLTPRDTRGYWFWRGSFALMIAAAMAFELGEYRWARLADVAAAAALIPFLLFVGVELRRRRSDRRLWSLFVGGIGVVSGFALSYLTHEYASTRPRTPDAATGRVYEVYDHGWVGYVRWPEQTALWILLGISVAAGACFAVLVVKEIRDRDPETRYVFERMAERKLLLAAAVLSAALVAFAALGTMYMLLTGLQRDSSSLIYVEQNVPSIMSTWSRGELLRRTAPEFLQRLADSRLDAMFSNAAKLGQLLTFGEVKGGSHFSITTKLAPEVTAAYSTHSRFEYGEATIHVRLIQHEGAWQITSFDISPRLFSKP